jgi:tetratricopeptide (TPR) repeat protein
MKMGTATNTYQLYHEALRNPAAVAEIDLLQLIEQFPYSQPLRYALVRRKTLLKEQKQSFEDALLYAPSPRWLRDYAHQPVVAEIEEVDVVSEDYVPFEEYNEQLVEANEYLVEGDLVPAEPETSVEENDVPEGVSQTDDGQDELEQLVQGGSVGGDYFVFEEKVQQADREKTDAPSEAENISLYNDDLMPYSFRWWLHKTRLEHADTYQPFATPILPPPAKGQFDPQKLDEAILDQQIKENIIHFQDPEMKLSDAVKSKPVEQAEERKDSKIIEKFIREEPIIQPPSAEQLNTENMARQSAEDSYALVTETLAGIYADQGLYLKAIEVFKKLILKYPEKKSYFATQIKELEEKL